MTSDNNIKPLNYFIPEKVLEVTFMCEGRVKMKKDIEDDGYPHIIYCTAKDGATAYKGFEELFIKACRGENSPNFFTPTAKPQLMWTLRGETNRDWSKH